MLNLINRFTILQALEVADITDNGIIIKHTMCDICTPGPHCGVDAYVKDGRIIKLEGTKGFPSNDGKLCARGAAGRQYVYRSDRITRPMRRVGPRGSSEFEPISWEEAFAETAKGLNAVKEQYGAASAAFICGYTKWFRPFLHRLAYSFGSPNYLTESSGCYWSGVMANRSIFGVTTAPDLMNTKLYVAWGSNPPIHAFPLARNLIALKKRGGKIIVIDSRNTQSVQMLADLVLRPRLGTDGYLAHAMARVIIESGLHDEAFIKKYVHGFEQYKQYAMGFDLASAEKVTGVPAEDIRTAALMFAETDPSLISPGTGITQRKNGFNNYRAIMSLMAITGRFDRMGTILPNAYETTFCGSNGGFKSFEEEFIDSVRPKNARQTVGLEQFPLFRDMMDEGQGMTLASQILSEKPYPIKAAFCTGVNNRMYPDSKQYLRALESLDFIASTELFWTDICKISDIVMPVCTSYERAEIKCYAGKFINYTSPAIEPLGESKTDVEVFSGLAKSLELSDKLLESGYDACARYILSPSGIKDWEAFRTSDGPIPIPNAQKYIVGSYLEGALKTPTGKIELFSQLIASYKRPDLNPLPIYIDSCDDAPQSEFDFVMCAGARLPNTIHSRLHEVSWTRLLRPKASVDINPIDADRLGISQEDEVVISTPVNSISLAANITETASPGELHMYHGYKEADANSLIDSEQLDPYTGFPSYKQFRCKIAKKEDL